MFSTPDQSGFLTTTLESALAWARKYSLFSYPFVTACCGMEFMSVAGPMYDTDRFGAALPRFTPRQADLLMVVGTITQKQAPILLKVYEQMQASFAAMGQHIALLELSPRGSWRVRTKKGAAIELGRGSLEDLQGRFQHFVETLPDVASKWGRQMSALEAVDLRHENGYALKLRGVTTGDARKTGR